MKNNYFIVVFFFLCSYSSVTYSVSIDYQNVPDDFRQMFDEEEKVVTVSFPSGISEKQTLLVSYDKIKLNKKDTSGIKKFKNILKNNNIKEKFINNILFDLTSSNGIKNTTECKGISSSCVVTTDSYAFFL